MSELVNKDILAELKKTNSLLANLLTEVKELNHPLSIDIDLPDPEAFRKDIVETVSRFREGFGKDLLTSNYQKSFV
jgi:predicted nucleotidyltransferase